MSIKAVDILMSKKLKVFVLKSDSSLFRKRLSLFYIDIKNSKGGINMIDEKELEIITQKLLKINKEVEDLKKLLIELLKSKQLLDW